jgi:hypothetical protein
MATKETSPDSFLYFSELGAQSTPSLSSVEPNPEDGVRLLRAFMTIRHAALREAVIELATKFAALGD